MEYDIFLSYSSSNESEARDLCATFEAKGLKCFLAKRDIAAGDNWSEAIRLALLDSNEICLLATPQSLKSEWVLIERGAAWVLGKRITPVLLHSDPDALPSYLRNVQAVDFHEKDQFAEEVKGRIGSQTSSAVRPPSIESGTGDVRWEYSSYPNHPGVGEKMSLTIKPAGEQLPVFPVPITCEIIAGGSVVANFPFNLSTRSGHTVNYTPPREGRYEVRWKHTDGGYFLAQDSFLVEMWS